MVDISQCRTLICLYPTVWLRKVGFLLGKSMFLSSLSLEVNNMLLSCFEFFNNLYSASLTLLTELCATHHPPTSLNYYVIVTRVTTNIRTFINSVFLKGTFSSLSLIEDKYLKITECFCRSTPRRLTSPQIITLNRHSSSMIKICWLR